MSFLIMAFFFGIITVLSQGKGPYEMIFPLYQRLLFGCFALVEYITKSLLPVNLNFFYPFPIVLGEEPPLHYYLYPVVLLFLMGWIIAYRNNRYLVFGALVFLFFYCFFLSVYTFHYTKKWENTTMVKKYTKEVLEKRLNGSNHL